MESLKMMITISNVTMQNTTKVDKLDKRVFAFSGGLKR